MLRQPFFAALDGAQRILIAGAGGGFDVFCGLPLYFALRDAGRKVFLANLSFSPLHDVGGAWVAPALLAVTADTLGPGVTGYFPEGHLTRWFRTQGEEVPIFCFEQTGVQPLTAAYRALHDLLGFDAVVLVDGGTDSLMRGDEFGLGTPGEDLSSIAAVDALPLSRKLLACIGFGIDHFHGVCHAQFLEAVAALTRAGAFLGAFALTPDMPEAIRYRQACEAVFQEMSQHVSIVNSSILSAIAGRYGDEHWTARTAGNVLWINPLMTLYWCFHIEAVARRCLYLDELKRTQTWEEVGSVVLEFRARLPAHRDWRSIPV
jgi:hypothetical protein